MIPAHLRCEILVAILPALCACESLVGWPLDQVPAERIHVELIAPDSEVSRITNLGTLAESVVSFSSLDGRAFEESVNYMIVSPGCRCICVRTEYGVGPWKIPLCFDAIAGHTYVVSLGSAGGLFSSDHLVWVNEWPGSLGIGDLRGTSGRNPRESALFINKIDSRGEIIRGGHPEERAHCASPPADCDLLGGLL